MANRRLQRRQVFWRSGTSTASERAGRSPTGQRVRTVAQPHRPARSVGARGGHEGPLAIPGPHPTFQPAAYATRTSRCPPAPEAVDAATPVDANNRAHRSLQNRADAVSHSDHSHHLLLHQDVDEPGNRPGVCIHANSGPTARIRVFSAVATIRVFQNSDVVLPVSFGFKDAHGATARRSSRLAANQPCSYRALRHVGRRLRRQSAPPSGRRSSPARPGSRAPRVMFPAASFSTHTVSWRVTSSWAHASRRCCRRRLTFPRSRRTAFLRRFRRLLPWWHWLIRGSWRRMRRLLFAAASRSCWNLQTCSSSSTAVMATAMPWSVPTLRPCWTGLLSGGRGTRR